MKTLAFFNNKGGVGKTTLVYHLSYMFSLLGQKTIVLDLDPQSNLSAMFLSESRLESMWTGKKDTILEALNEFLSGTGAITSPHIEQINPKLGLITGNLGLSGVEDELSLQWSQCFTSNEPTKKRAFRVVSMFYKLATLAAAEFEAQWVFYDVGPNLGALNRCALLASDNVVIPMGADLFSLQGLNNLGPALRNWKDEWNQRLNVAPADIKPELPQSEMNPIGYVISQHGIRETRPVRSYLKWANKIPKAYAELIAQNSAVATEPANDPNCLALIKHYHSLMPMAMDARKPIFELTPADGAIGSHIYAVGKVKDDFKALAKKIAEKCGEEI